MTAGKDKHLCGGDSRRCEVFCSDAARMQPFGVQPNGRPLTQNELQRQRNEKRIDKLLKSKCRRRTEPKP